MADKFVVIETPSVSKRKENIMAIINQDPKRIYEDKKSLVAIHEITKASNASRKSQGRAYSIRFKLYSEDDMTLYELECNRIIEEKEGAKEFSSVNEFTKWYKDRAVEIIKEIKMDEEVQEYIRNSRKK